MGRVGGLGKIKSNAKLRGREDRSSLSLPLASQRLLFQSRPCNFVLVLVPSVIIFTSSATTLITSVTVVSCCCNYRNTAGIIPRTSLKSNRRDSSRVPGVASAVLFVFCFSSVLL